MAKNWTVAEATEEILNGNKEAIVDIGRRFPLTSRAIAVAGDKAKDILSAFNFITVRKVESILKDGVEEYSDDNVEDPTEKPAKKEKVEKPAKEKKAPAKKEEKPVTKKTVKKAEMNEPEEDDEDYESMSEVELFKICKKKGLKPAPKQKKKYYLDLLKSENEEEAWNEEEDEKPAKKAPAKKSKKAAEDEDDDWDI